MFKRYPISRRNFIKTASIGGIGLADRSVFAGLTGILSASPDNDLYTLSQGLVKDWGEALIHLQVTSSADSLKYGGIISPATNAVHGRVGDAIYPFLHLAKKYNDHRYADGARLLFDWIERNVSQPDGSWLNEPKKGSWKGTTVFAAIGLGEALKHHADIMDPAFKTLIENRLKKAGDYIYQNFDMDYGNINYPINGSYALTLLGTLLDDSRFKKRGAELAQKALSFFTGTDHFIFGEGDPYYAASKKGCFSVDLGYNVEESLPALTMYGLHTGDRNVLDAVTRSLKTHLEFMLPDGGWDNSWGTRNYKWTYWGSRTTDGCQPAYALLADKTPVFYKAALKNTQLLKQQTVNGLLQGGPHNHSRQITPSVHHTFCHIKALTAILDYGIPKTRQNGILLPREKAYGSRFFKDVQTWLISKGKFRATVTGYDREYKKTHNGHASGGALTMLWHETAGIILSASMNEYQMIEADNMQSDAGIATMPLTPRIEYRESGVTYTNIADLSAGITEHSADNSTSLNVLSALVDAEQNNPPTGKINCQIQYQFTGDKVICKYECNATANQDVTVFFPIISQASERIKVISERELWVYKGKNVLKITCNNSFAFPQNAETRVFNFVPGLEAIPLAIKHPKTTIEISII